MSDNTTRPLTEFDRQCIQAFQTWHSLGRPEDTKQVAKVLEIPRHTFSNRLLKYFLRDLGANLPFEMQKGMELKNHAVTLDQDGNVTSETYRTGLESSDEGWEMPEGYRMSRGTFQVRNGVVERQWVKISENGPDEAAIVESIKMAAQEAGVVADRAARDMNLVNTVPASEDVEKLMNLHPLPDLHLGLYVWGKHCGVAWDLDKALTCIRAIMLNLMQRAPAAKCGVILGGGDLLHADDETKKTRRSGHVLDVDGRYPKVLKEAQLLLVYQAELALEKYDYVIIRILPGNHDDDSAVAVTHFLWAWFRNEPRVTIDMNPGPFFHHEWGRVMLSGVHGHETKIEKMPGVMAADEPETWGRTKFRYAHGFHWHSKKSGEADGAEWEVHRTPIPRDAYANDYGYRSGRSMEVITYNKETGEEDRTIKNL